MGAYASLMREFPADRYGWESLFTTGKRLGVLPESVIALIEERDHLETGQQDAMRSKDDAARTVTRKVAEGRKPSQADLLALVSGDALRDALQDGYAELTYALRDQVRAEEGAILATLDDRLRTAWQPILDLAESVEPSDTSDGLVLQGRADEAKRLLEAPVLLRRVEELARFRGSLANLTGSTRDIGRHWSLWWEREPSTEKPLNVVADALVEAKQGNRPRARQVAEALEIVAELRQKAAEKREAARKSVPHYNLTFGV